MADEIPQWAIRRARELFEAEQSLGLAGHANRAFARYIMEHEEPPVNPVHAAIETALARFYDPHSSKEWPGTVVIRSAIMDEFSRRGIELGKAGEA